MTIKHLVKAISTNTFNAEDIETLDQLLSVHEGKTLFQYIAESPYYHSMMDAVMSRAEKLYSQTLTATSRRADLKFGIIYYGLLSQFRDTLGQKESLDRLHEIAQNPKGAFKFLQIGEKALLLLIEDYVNVQKSLPFTLRNQGLLGQFALLLEDCDTFEQLKEKKVKFWQLRTHPLFSTGANTQPSTFKKIGLALGLNKDAPLAEHQSESQLILGEITDMLDALLIDKPNVNQAALLAKRLIRFYPFANEKLQALIVTKVNALVENDPTAELVAAVMDAAFTYPVGNSLRHTQSPSPCILSKFSEKANRFVLEMLSILPGTTAERAYYKNTFELVKSAKAVDPVSLYFQFSPETAKAEARVAALLALGKFPQVSAVNINLKSQALAQLELNRSLAGSEKVRFMVSSRDEIVDYRYSNVFSYYPSKSFVNLLTLGDGELLNQCILDLSSHGFTEFRICLATTPTSQLAGIFQLIASLGALPEENSRLHLVIPVENAEPLDLYYDGKTLTPGPMTLKGEYTNNMFTTYKPKDNMVSRLMLPSRDTSPSPPAVTQTSTVAASSSNSNSSGSPKNTN